MLGSGWRWEAGAGGGVEVDGAQVEVVGGGGGVIDPPGQHASL